MGLICLEIGPKMWRHSTSQAGCRRKDSLNLFLSKTNLISKTLINCKCHGGQMHDNIINVLNCLYLLISKIGDCGVGGEETRLFALLQSSSCKSGQAFIIIS